MASFVRRWETRRYGIGAYGAIPFLDDLESLRIEAVETGEHG